MRHETFQRLAVPVAGSVLFVWEGVLWAAETEAGQSSNLWEWVITVIVVAVTLASAALPAAACRQWNGGWQAAASLPLFILVLWSAVLIFLRITDPASHRPWLLEIFCWAMLNMVYMVVLMTGKRRAEPTDQPSSEPMQSKQQ